MQPINIASIKWPTDIKNIATEFSSYRHKVREEVANLIGEFQAFPTYSSDLPQFHLERLESRCLPPRAAKLMRSKAHRSVK